MEFNQLVGKTLTSCVWEREHDHEIRFTDTLGKRYKLYHRQDCCEYVSVEDINGQLSDLVGSPILRADETTSNHNPPEIPNCPVGDSFKWTFYRLATLSGYVVIRWYGSSNGYYSESVDFSECDENWEVIY